MLFLNSVYSGANPVLNPGKMTRSHQGGEHGKETKEETGSDQEANHLFLPINDLFVLLDAEEFCLDLLYMFTVAVNSKI